MNTRDTADDADSSRRTLWAMLLTGGFMIVEVIGGIVSGSLALLADAGHMLTDTAALALAWFAFRVATRPADAKRTYGYHRFQILIAFVNGLTLVAIVGWICIEALHRFFQPVEIIGGTMLVVAVLGLLVNIIAFRILHGGDRENLNLRGAAIHVVGDLLGSLAAIVAAVVVLWFDWTPIDPLLSVLVALLILRSAWSLLRKSAHILLEGKPEWLNIANMREELVRAVPELRNVHHVHVWSLTPQNLLLTMHAEVRTGIDQPRVLRDIKRTLNEEFGIAHATIEFEFGQCADDTLDENGHDGNRTRLNTVSD